MKRQKTTYVWKVTGWYLSTGKYRSTSRLEDYVVTDTNSIKLALHVAETILEDKLKLEEEKTTADIQQIEKLCIAHGLEWEADCLAGLKT